MDAPEDLRKHALYILPRDRDFDFDSLLQTVQDECNGDDPFGSNSPLTSPEASPPPSPALLPQEVTSTDPIFEMDQSGVGPIRQTKSNHAKRQGHSSRRKRRKEDKDRKNLNNEAAIYEPRASSSSKHIRPSSALHTDVDSENQLLAASTGYVGARGSGRGGRRMLPLQIFIEPNSRFGLELKHWDGRVSIPILDQKRRVIAVLVGCPGNGVGHSGVTREWQRLNELACQALEDARSKLTFSSKEKVHRRGRFPALGVGISHGSGQTRPGNLHHSSHNMAILQQLLANEAFIRLSGFVIGAFGTWAPKLHAYYVETLNKLLKHDPNLFLNFANGVWAAATFNFGPKTVCFKHKDCANLPHGWCGITALGNFNPNLGGHIIFWQLGLIIQFPPASSILVPSASVDHQNVPIGADERRYSFTQYTAGALFRWAEHGFQKEEEYLGSLTAKGREQELKRMSEMMKKGLNMFSTIDELAQSK